MQKSKNVIVKVETNSIAEEVGIEVGDILISINSKYIVDVFDYRYLIDDDYIEVEIQKPNGEKFIAEIDKDFDEDLGISFESGLIDNAKSCQNRCIFCFIDQMPPDMRDTLYFKDDDSRLSFLQGNYVTLTNMNQRDIDRIVYYHLSPINISIHTTDMELRKFMLHNSKADKLFDYIEQFEMAGIEMNCQVVLCKGINDGQHLNRTIDDLSAHIPKIKSLSIVPVGITKFRDNLYKLNPFEKEDALNVIETVNFWQQRLKLQYNSRFVFASDEFYLIAEVPIPDIKYYEDFPQIENGVGMMSLMEYELKQALNKTKIDSVNRKLSIATGEAAYRYICRLCSMIEQKFKNTDIDVYCIKNNFFGGKVTVTGLLTGTDIFEQLKNIDLKGNLFLSESVLKADDTLFLDNMDISELQSKLNTKIFTVKNNGYEFLKSILSVNSEIL